MLVDCFAHYLQLLREGTSLSPFSATSNNARTYLWDPTPRYLGEARESRFSFACWKKERLKQIVVLWSGTPNWLSGPEIRGLEEDSGNSPQTKCAYLSLCMHSHFLASGDSQCGLYLPNRKAPELLGGPEPERTKKMMEVKYSKKSSSFWIIILSFSFTCTLIKQVRKRKTRSWHMSVHSEGKETFSFYPSGFFGWSHNYIDVKQMNRKRPNLILCLRKPIKHWGSYKWPKQAASIPFRKRNKKFLKNWQNRGLGLK